MSRRRFHVKKGDQVEVITGAHKGATGTIMQVLPGKQQVIIEGVRLIKKHEKKSQDRPQGAITEREGPIHVSNVRAVETAKPKARKKTAAKTAAPKKKKSAGKADASD